MKFSAASRPSTIPTSSPSLSLFLADPKCSRATSIHLRLVSSLVSRPQNGLVVRPRCLLRFL
jgi:hypothetical protein